MENQKGFNSEKSFILAGVFFLSWNLRSSQEANILNAIGLQKDNYTLS